MEFDFTRQDTIKVNGYQFWFIAIGVVNDSDGVGIFCPQNAKLCFDLLIHVSGEFMNIAVPTEQPTSSETISESQVTFALKLTEGLLRRTNDLSITSPKVITLLKKFLTTITVDEYFELYKTIQSYKVALGAHDRDIEQKQDIKVWLEFTKESLDTRIIEKFTTHLKNQIDYSSTKLTSNSLKEQHINEFIESLPKLLQLQIRAKLYIDENKIVASHSNLPKPFYEAAKAVGIENLPKSFEELEYFQETPKAGVRVTTHYPMIGDEISMQKMKVFYSSVTTSNPSRKNNK